MAASRRTLFDQRESSHRQKEFMREDLIKQVKSEASMRSHLAIEDRVDNARRLRALKQREEEFKLATMLLEKEEARKIRERKRFEDEQLRQELEARQVAEIRERKIKQSIQDNSLELRQLKSCLQSAAMNQERSRQIKEKQLSQQREKNMEQIFLNQLAEKIQREKEEEELKEKEALLKGRNYKEDLQNQLTELEQRKKMDYEQFLKEKAMIDEIARKIAEDDELEHLTRLQKAQESRQFIESYLNQRQEWKRLEQQKMEEENQKIELYAKMQREREADLAAKKKANEDQRGAIYEKLASEMEAKEKFKEELEEVRIELSQQEQLDRDRQREQELMEKRIRERLALIDAYKEQIRHKRLLRQKEKEEEEVFRKKMLDKFAEDCRIDQLTAQARRLKQLEHKKAVETMILERRKQAEIEKAKEAEERAKELELEKFKQEVVEMERARLLRDCAVGLKDFLPKGVLRDARDLELFDEEFKRRFENRSKTDIVGGYD
ncbi:tumor suppressor, Mitostatin-domain-containing protein [Paraphysoderma sedebokerense]|nr:tumor suppressor, Mitostatin-domain-containing protein [Paraphysoderma sedebokerense]